MYQNPYTNTLETRVLAATPLELVRMLYEGALDSVRAARRHLAEGDIPKRSRAITKAVEILIELTRSLDQTRGGELSVRLAEIYDYLQKTLLEANFLQTDEGLESSERVLATLLEAWVQLDAGSAAATPAAGALPWAAQDRPSLQSWSA